MADKCPWYNLARWRRRRLAHLREHPLCVMCGEEGRITSATVADHVTPHRGNAELFWYGRLQSLCASHHSRDKQQIEGKGFSTAVGADGWPTHPQHPANRR